MSDMVFKYGSPMPSRIENDGFTQYPFREYQRGVAEGIV